MKRKQRDEDPDSGSCKKILKMSYSQMDPRFNGGTMCQASNSDADSDLRRIVNNFVNLYENLDTCNDVNTKPNYSYTELVYLALMRSPNFCLPITEIYKYIESRFLFFKNSTREHWKNAARHSLSKTKCFTKIGVGRGSCTNGNLSRSTYLWCIVPLSIASFARGDYRATLDKAIGNANALRSRFYRSNAGHFWEQIGHHIARQMEIFRQVLMTSPDPGAIFQLQVCRLSVDQPLHTCTPIPTSMLMTPYHPLTYGQPSYTGGSFEDHKESEYEPLNGPIASGHENKTTIMTSTSVPYMQYEMTPSTSDAAYAEKTDHNHNPWLSKTISSPDSSLCSTESDRRTPPFIHDFVRDSGNETLSSESSPEEYYRSLPSCRMQVNENCRASPPLCAETVQVENILNFDAIQGQDKVFGNPQEFSYMNYLLSPNAECQGVSNVSTAYRFHGNSVNLPEVYPQYELSQSVYTAVENPFT